MILLLTRISRSALADFGSSMIAPGLIDTTSSTGIIRSAI
jgi:hypothetical protein